MGPKGLLLLCLRQGALRGQRLDMLVEGATILQLYLDASDHVCGSACTSSRVELRHTAADRAEVHASKTPQEQAPWTSCTMPTPFNGHMSPRSG